jgi:type IV pilus assembly protein PilC
MAFYKYKVRDSKGGTKSGLVEAKSKSDAAGILRRKGDFVLSLTESSQTKIPFSGFFNKISSSKITDFTRQLSTMIDAGLNLTKSLQILASQTKSEAMNKLLEDILADVEGGARFTDALEKKSKYFSKTYTALIRSGEASGTLDKVLNRLADNLEKQREFKNKVKGAMIYPVIVMAGMGIVMFIMMAFVVPKLTDLYSEFEIDLPMATQVLITIANIFANYWLLILIGVIGVIAAFIKWKSSGSGKRIWDRILISIPLFGELQKEVSLIEAARTLGVLIGAGLPITEALAIVSDATTNSVYKKGIEDARRAVEKGFPLGETISRNENFPPIFSEMITIGEETGKLDEVLQRLANFFETKSNETVKGLTTAIEPLIMVVLGLGVGFLVLAIITPIYNLTSSIK